MSTATLITVGRRRRFSLAEKEALVLAAFGPGGCVAETARRAEICTSLLYRWRRTMEVEAAAGPGFVPVVVKSSASASSDPVVVVEFALGARVSVGAGAPAALVSAVLQALR